jgi:hypothetical protein
MEPVSVTVGAVVAALVLKGAEKTGEKVTEGGSEAVGRLVERVRRRFQDRGDEAGQAALARVQDPPVAERQLVALAAAVDHHAGQDPAFAEELRRLVREHEAAGVDVQHVTQVAWGSQISQLKDVTGSTITITFGQPRG